MEHVLTEGDVRAMARAAGLPLPPDRAAEVAAVLAEWLPAANALSRTMSDLHYLPLMPITVLTHPQPDPTE